MASIFRRSALRPYPSASEHGADQTVGASSATAHSAPTFEGRRLDRPTEDVEDQGLAFDVVTLLDATERRFRDARRPLVTVAMGALGAPSRLVGGVFGSAATFATAGAASAPGQLPVDDVRSVLDVLARAAGDGGQA